MRPPRCGPPRLEKTHSIPARAAPTTARLAVRRRTRPRARDTAKRGTYCGVCERIVSRFSPRGRAAGSDGHFLNPGRPPETGAGQSRAASFFRATAYTMRSGGGFLNFAAPTQTSCDQRPHQRLVSLCFDPPFRLFHPPLVFITYVGRARVFLASFPFLFRCGWRVGRPFLTWSLCVCVCVCLSVCLCGWGCARRQHA